MLHCSAVASFVREEDDSTGFYSTYYKLRNGRAQFAWETNEYVKVPMKSGAAMARCEKGHDRLVSVNNQIVIGWLDTTLSLQQGPIRPYV